MLERTDCHVVQCGGGPRLELMLRVSSSGNLVSNDSAKRLADQRPRLDLP